MVTKYKKRRVPTISQVDSFTWRMGGEARQDIDKAALILSRALVRGGYFAHANAEYGSIVTGGNVNFELRMSTKPVASLAGDSHILMAKDERTLKMWHKQVVKNGGVLLDAEAFDLAPYRKALNAKQIEIIHVPFGELLRKNLLPEITYNSMMLGALVGLIDFDIKDLYEALKQVYGAEKKSEGERHVKAAQLGFDYARKNYTVKYACPVRKHRKVHYLIEGNEAVILGALKAGMKSYTGYAMTPVSGILHQNILLEKRFNLFSYMPEDEISACLFALGASLAGARAMTGTSGGGFALMSEAIGLSAMSETPLVVIVGSRAGPSTGVATRHSQGDLRFVLHAGQEQPPRIVLAPSDPKEAFELTFHAFNLAEKYQTLVIILTDKYLQESFWTETPLEHKQLKVDRGKLLTQTQTNKLKDYKRYKLMTDGVSPLATPGSDNPNVIWRANSSEHDEHGFTSEEKSNRIKQMNKRARKIKTAYSEYISKIDPISRYGDSKAKVAIITFGSNKGPVLDATKSFKAKTIKSIVVKCLMPFPKKELLKELAGVEKIFFVEGNQDGLLEGVVREQTGREATGSYRFYDARPPTYVQIKNFLTENL